MQMYDLPDARGHFGPYGGVFVAETLIRALDELKAQYEGARLDPAFKAEFERELKHYVGRPSPRGTARGYGKGAGSATGRHRTSPRRSRTYASARLSAS